jgi:hypothetical protein
LTPFRNRKIPKPKPQTTLSRIKTHLLRHKAFKRLNNRANRKRILGTLIVLSIIGSLYYLPIFYPYFKNEILAPPPPVHANDRIILPYDLTKPDKGALADIFITLTTDTDFIVGQPFSATITASMPNSLTPNIPAGMAGYLDNSLWFPILTIPNTTAAFPSFIEMTAGSPNEPGYTMWSGTQMVEYTVSGNFGVILTFYNYTQIPPVTGIVYITKIDEVHTIPLFSIAPQDSFVLKRSQSLTMTLTLLLLLFVILDFSRAEQNRKDA